MQDINATQISVFQNITRLIILESTKEGHHPITNTTLSIYNNGTLGGEPTGGRTTIWWMNVTVR